MTYWADRLDQLVAGTASKPPCVETLGLPQLKGWLPGRVWTQWTVDPKLFHGGDAVFGGYLASLADQVLGLATVSILAEGEAFATSDLRISFFRPVTGGSLHVEGQVVHRGRGMAHVEVVFTRDDGKVAGRATATQVITQAPPGDRDKPIAKVKSNS